MDTWFSKPLGDAIVAFEPLMALFDAFLVTGDGNHREAASVRSRYP
jgi:hypothetical protein